MSLTRFIVNLAVKNKKIEKYNSYLFIGPHPDDIEIGCAQTVSKLKKLNKKVTFLICTDGRYGTENIKEPITQDDLANLRKEESIKSANYLGVDEIIFLDLKDGAMYEYDILVKRIAEVINKIKPDVIFAPDPDVSSECHIDHLNVGKAAKELANFANFKDIFKKYINDEVNDLNVDALCLYFTNKPNKYVRTLGHFKRQLTAIDYHQSQYPKNHPSTKSIKLYLNVRSIDFGLRKLSIRAEGYRMLNRTRMHCLPEATK